MGREEKALEFFRNGCNCAQAGFAAFADRTGISENDAKAAALGFGAGIGRLQGICGAVSGAVMALGAVMQAEADPANLKPAAYAKVREFIAAFEKENGTTECLRLLGGNLMDAEMNAYMNEKKFFAVKCEKYVADSCRILGSMVDR